MTDRVEVRARNGRDGYACDHGREPTRRDRGRAAEFAALQWLVTERIESGVSDRSIGDVVEAARSASGVTGGRRPVP